MRPEDVFAKTAKGNEEILTRVHKLPPQLRTVLIMIDGKSSAADILRQTTQLKTTPELVDKLLADGFIEITAASATIRAAAPAAAPAPAETNLTDGQRFTNAKQFMNETVVNAAGLRSFAFTLKLEKSNTLDDLRSLITDYSRIIEKGTGAVEAEVMVKRAKEMLM